MLQEAIPIPDTMLGMEVTDVVVAVLFFMFGILATKLWPVIKRKIK